jgi:hypothetical protein
MAAPGLLFCVLETQSVAENPNVLCRTPSTYYWGDKLELATVTDCLYVICKDGSVQNAEDPEVPIGWELLKTETGWAYRISQYGFDPQPCTIQVRSSGQVPEGGRGIGNKIVFSRYADICEEEDEGEPEVTSEFSFPGRVQTPDYPGSPRKIRNPFFNSDV